MPLNTKTTVKTTRGSGQTVQRTEERSSEQTPGKTVSTSVEQSPVMTTTETRPRTESTSTETGGDQTKKVYSHHAYTIKFIVPVK
jgi:hypothetical protein